MDMQFFRDMLAAKIDNWQQAYDRAEADLDLWKDRRHELADDAPEWVVDMIDEKIESCDMALAAARVHLAKWRERLEALENVEFIDRRKK